MNKMLYRKVQAVELSMESLADVGMEPSYDTTDTILSECGVDLFIQKLPRQYGQVCRYLSEGYSWTAIMQKMNIGKYELSRIRERIQDIIESDNGIDFEKWVEENQKELNVLFDVVAQNVQGLPLSSFNQIYVNAYDGEAQIKKWKTIPLQDVYEDIWEKNQNSLILAPREHLKTTSLLQYLIKKIFLRKFPLEINYYHFNDQIANEKFQKLKRYIQKSPYLSLNFRMKEADTWSKSKIELADGTIIQPMSYQSGNIGKHPHIIVLDDVIDKSVIYSDDLNKKAIDNFYTNIYPQISKKDNDKKIMAIGTVQRKDDLYANLPDSFSKHVFEAIKQDGQPLSPELFSLADLERIRKDISSKQGERFWLKEYMNRPFEALGFIIKKEYIQYYSHEPQGLIIYQGWDLSVGKNIEKGDFTVGATIGIEPIGTKIKIYVIDIVRARLNFDQRLKMIVDKANLYKPTAIGIENNAFQYDTVQQLKNKTLFPIFGMKSVINKVESFQVELAPYFENGQIYIKPDMKELESELLSLPVGDFDDQADALKFAIKVSLQYKQKAPSISFV